MPSAELTPNAARGARTSDGRLVLGALFRHQRSETIQRAHHLADRLVATWVERAVVSTIASSDQSLDHSFGGPLKQMRCEAVSSVCGGRRRPISAMWAAAWQHAELAYRHGWTGFWPGNSQPSGRAMRYQSR